ncbi:MAG: hypothetical protein JO068_16465 [Hyphomicrobiales bacterium]|nr:hypothetical protein [Hyphomicrobiales bacterium]
MGDTIVDKTEFTLTGHTVSAVPWHYIATLDLNAACLAGGGWVVVDLIAKGDDIGVGIENKAGNDFLTRQFVKPRRESERVSLRVAAFDQIGRFVVENGDLKNPASVELTALKVIPDDGSAQSSCPE